MHLLEGYQCGSAVVQQQNRRLLCQQVQGSYRFTGNGSQFCDVAEEIPEAEHPCAGRFLTMFRATFCIAPVQHREDLNSKTVLWMHDCQKQQCIRLTQSRAFAH